MKWLRLFLLLELIALTVYTVWVVQVHGWSFLPYFLDNLTAVNWSGQFNLDFLMVLSLLGIWVSWRHGHSPFGLLFGLCTATGGVMFLFTYLLLEIARCKGDVRALLLGVRNGVV